MTIVEDLVTRNAAFASDGFMAELKILPSKKIMIVGCVDPRVDPMDIFNLEPGEAAIIRNVGGRVNPSLVETLNILSVVSKAGGAEMGEDWNLIILQHTKCGIAGCYHHAPQLLLNYMGVDDQKDLQGLSITAPYAAVVLDIATLRSNPNLPAGITVSGLVYDVDTGRVETVVEATRLRP